MLLIASAVVSLLIWRKLVKHEESLELIYVGGIIGAAIGAKVAFWLAESWVYTETQWFWEQFLSGRSITGALLGGYLGVELSKHYSGVQKATGDTFALLIPVTLILGRFGCLAHGCCLGDICEASWFAIQDVDGLWRYPAPLFEALFNALFLFWAIIAFKRGWQRNQLFHIYLITYGAFRFIHEFYRATPEIISDFTGYQLISLAILAVGIWRYVVRQRQSFVPVQAP